jgi:hypothetical protein
LTLNVAVIIVRKNSFDLFFTVRKKIFESLPPPPPIVFLGKIVDRNKNLLQGIISFGRAILADTPQIKRG